MTADAKPGSVFFDTNIALYLIGSDRRKALRSEALFDKGGTISVQVLNEFASAAIRKTARTWAEILDMLDAIQLNTNVLPVTLETHRRGLELAQRYRFSIYDSMIIAAAQLAGCSVLYSEDMQNGQVIDSLTIRNPYSAN